MAGIERANGHRPTGLMNVFHPELRDAPRPDPDSVAFDLDLALGAVVRLHAHVPEDAFTTHSLGDEREGSGVVIDDDGLVLTIGYLIVEATAVTLGLTGGRTVAAEVAAYDHETGFGMVRALEPLGVKPLALGSCRDVAPGDEIFIASHGGLDHSIAGHLVSRREFAGSWEYMLDEALFTVPLHPFWGGAALIDRRGELIGTGSLFVADADDAGGEDTLAGNMFVPIDLLSPIRDDMTAMGRARREPRPWLGLHAVEFDDRLVVSGVAPDGPADAAGIQPGDTLLSLEGQPVNTLPQMYRLLWSAGPAGAEVRVTILREDEEDVLNATIYSGDRYEFLKLPRRH